MPRKRKKGPRGTEADPIFGDRTISKCINKVMLDGKKGLAQKLFYTAMKLVKDRTGEDPLEVFKRAISNVGPRLEVRPRRVGGATYQVPLEVDPDRRETLAIRWLINAARNRGDRKMVERLASEIMDAAEGQGMAVRRKEEMHRMAEANKAFAQYRW